MSAKTNKPSLDLTQVKLDLIPLYSQVGSATKSVPCLLALRAPDQIIASKRPPLNLAVSLDISGSMSGAPLLSSQRAICTLLDSLRPQDRIALTAYASRSFVVSPSQLATPANVQTMKLAINNLKSRDSTNLYDGWLTAANAVAPFATKEVLSRVLLFSDGGANVGLTNSGEIAQAVAKLTQSGEVETSTYGIGYNFNEELMVAMGRAGSGQSFYASTAEELTGYLETEMGLIDRTVGINLRASLTSQHPTSVEFTWPEGVSASMSRLIAGAHSWTVCNLVLPSAIKNAKGNKTKSVIEFSAQVSWDSLDGESHLSIANAKIKLGVKNSELNSEVQNRVQELEAAQIQQQARAAASRGDWQTTDHLVGCLRASAGNNAYLQAVSDNLSTLANSRNTTGFTKEALYASTTMSTRQVANDEDATTLATDSLGLRKAEQGKAVPVKSAHPLGGV